jgi:hypothetical protein
MRSRPRVTARLVTGLDPVAMAAASAGELHAEQMPPCNRAFRDGDPGLASDVAGGSAHCVCNVLQRAAAARRSRHRRGRGGFRRSAWSGRFSRCRWRSWGRFRWCDCYRRHVCCRWRSGFGGRVGHGRLGRLGWHGWASRFCQPRCRSRVGQGLGDGWHASSWSGGDRGCGSRAFAARESVLSGPWPAGQQKIALSRWSTATPPSA